MAEQQITYESVLKMFRRTDRLMKMHSAETDRKIQETAAQMKETDRRWEETKREMKESARRVDIAIERMSQEVGNLGSSIGRIIEHMVAGNIVAKFQAFDYEITRCSQRHEFHDCKGLGISGEVDLLLENGEIAILIEVKTTLETADVRAHIERLEKYRKCADLGGFDKRRFIGAVAGAVVSTEVANFARKKGMYVIVQSGEAVEIVTPPKGFKAKEW
jgi:hypothetical protein